MSIEVLEWNFIYFGFNLSKYSIKSDKYELQVWIPNRQVTIGEPISPARKIDKIQII